MTKVLVFLALSTLCTSAVAQFDFEFSYSRQDLWEGLCNSELARKGSPINILTSDAVDFDDLISLEFDSRWTDELDGVFSNTGFPGVQFFGNGERATFRNHLGVYELLQFHMHWGPQNDNGTGHQINGQRFAVEFHFACAKMGADLSNLGPDTPSDTIAVISLLAEADDSMPISGVWEKLNPTMVINRNDSINVTGISYSSILPENRNYFFYEGGQTSPGCYEFVQWFVLHDRIQVPSGWMDQLRTTRFANGELIY